MSRFSMGAEGVLASEARRALYADAHRPETQAESDQRDEQMRVDRSDPRVAMAFADAPMAVRHFGPGQEAGGVRIF